MASILIEAEELIELMTMAKLGVNGGMKSTLDYSTPAAMFRIHEQEEESKIKALEVINKYQYVMQFGANRLQKGKCTKCKQ